MLTFVIIKTTIMLPKKLYMKDHPLFKSEKKCDGTFELPEIISPIGYDVVGVNERFIGLAPSIITKVSESKGMLVVTINSYSQVINRRDKLKVNWAPSDCVIFVQNVLPLEYKNGKYFYNVILKKTVGRFAKESIYDKLVGLDANKIFIY